jgi:hypothetical protein
MDRVGLFTPHPTRSDVIVVGRSPEKMRAAVAAQHVIPNAWKPAT